MEMLISMPSWLMLRTTNHVESLQDSKALRQHLEILLIPVVNDGNVNLNAVLVGVANAQPR